MFEPLVVISTVAYNGPFVSRCSRVNLGFCRLQFIANSEN